MRATLTFTDKRSALALAARRLKHETHHHERVERPSLNGRYGARSVAVPENEPQNRRKVRRNFDDTGMYVTAGRRITMGKPMWRKTKQSTTSAAICTHRAIDSLRTLRDEIVT